MRKRKNLKHNIDCRKVIQIKEEDIRSDYLIKEYSKLLIKDIRQLMKQKNGFVRVPCPACESRSQRIIFKKNGFSFVMCRECETVFINPRPTLDMLTEFYAMSKSIKYWNDKIFPASEDCRRSQIFAPRAKKVIELCRKHNVSTRILLDVGAGFGTFCEEVKKLNVFNKVIAVEPSYSLAETCFRKGIETIEKPIEKLILKEVKRVSVITNFELIEHLYWPKDFLITCGQVLPEGGILILTTPNIKGFELLVLGKIADNISGPNHLNYFNPQSLSYLLKNCGFEIIETETPGKLDAELVRKNVLKGKFNISSHPFLKEILIEKWEAVGGLFQEFLANNMLSSHLWVVARKQ